MTKEYNKAKNLILGKWKTFREDINDYLPDYQYHGLARPSYYKYYEYFDDSDISYCAKKIKDFAQCVNSTVMRDHNAFEMNGIIQDIEKSEKEKDMLRFLTSVYRAFEQFRTVVVVLERLT